MITLEEILSTAPMRALSWKQPYGSAMLHGKIETRKRDTIYRGLVLICLSKMPYNEDVARRISGNGLFAEMCLKLKDEPTLDMDGHAIAVGRLVKSQSPLLMSASEYADAALKTFVQDDTFLWFHFYEDVTRIKPFPWKGSQGWRTVPSDIRNKIELLK